MCNLSACIAKGIYNTFHSSNSTTTTSFFSSVKLAWLCCTDGTYPFWEFQITFMLNRRLEMITGVRSQVLSASKDSWLSKVWNFQKGFKHNFDNTKLCLKFSVFQINDVNLKLILRHNCHCNQEDLSFQYLFLSPCHWALGMIFYFE